VDTITPEVVEMMARAGCQAICFGVESGNQEILDLAKKKSDLQKVRGAMRMTQATGISAIASFIIGLPGETAETLRKTTEFARELHEEYGSLCGIHVLAPFPGTEVRRRASHFGLEILTDDWRKYDANQAVAHTRGATADVIQEFSDAYEETLGRYLQYQHWLYANDRLEGYERRVYVQRRRQALLWKLLLDDVIESLPAFRRDPLDELGAAVVEATGAPPGYVKAELERVLELGALVQHETPEGTCFTWSE
jgi:radical SAM superfamily enzyme YgiQ (UPF0313 family)